MGDGNGRGLFFAKKFFFFFFFFFVFFFFFWGGRGAAARKIFGASRAKLFHLYYPAVGCLPVIECEKAMVQPNAGY